MLSAHEIEKNHFTLEMLLLLAILLHRRCAPVSYPISSEMLPLFLVLWHPGRWAASPAWSLIKGGGAGRGRGRVSHGRAEGGRRKAAGKAWPVGRCGGWVREGGGCGARPVSVDGAGRACGRVGGRRGGDRVGCRVGEGS